MDFIGPEYAWMLHDPPGVELQMDEEGKGPGHQEDLGEQGTRGPGPEDQGTKGSGEPEIVFPVNLYIYIYFCPGNLDFDSSIIPPPRWLARSHDHTSGVPRRSGPIFAHTPSGPAAARLGPL